MNIQQVPWFNSIEWRDVYNGIFGENSSSTTKNNALALMYVWKARSPVLASGIESTMSLLEVEMQEVEKVSEPMLKMAYGSAIMRFVNHTIDTDQKKATNLYNTARMKNIPDWMVNLRHDIAHNNSYPKLEQLKLAADFALDWLKENYWMEQDKIISDCIVTENLKTNLDSNDLEECISFYISLSTCAHPKLKIRNLSQVPDKKMQAELLAEAEQLFSSQLTFTDKSNISISNLISLTEAHICKFIYERNSSSIIVEAILGKSSLFLSEEVLSLMIKDNIQNVSILPKGYVILWEPLLVFLHSNNMIFPLIDKLLNITIDNHRNNSVKKLAALWLGELFKSFERNMEYQRKAKKNNIKTRDRKQIKTLMVKWFPNTHHKLLLNPFKSTPSQLSDLTYVEGIITAYNPYLVFFVKDLLKLVKPSISSAVMENLTKLASLISEDNMLKNGFNLVDSKVYTVNDVKSLLDFDMSNISSDSDCIMMDVDGNHDESNVLDGSWRLASAEHNWADCPIGLLPWQQSRLSVE